MFKLIISNINLAFEAIKSQKLRAGITMLIIAFGIMALVGTLTVVNGIDNNFSAGLRSLGSNKFSFKRYENNFLQGNRHHRRGRKKINPRISYRDAISFKKSFKDKQAKVSISFFAGMDVEVKSDDKKSDPQYNVFGIDENYMDVQAIEVEKGKVFSIKDIENNRPYALIGQDLRRELFKDINPLQKEIIIKGNRFKVIGVLPHKASTFGGSENNKILIPLNLARSIFPNAGNYNINVSVRDKNKYEYLVSQAVSMMRKIRKLRPVEANNFGINRSDKLEKELKKVSGTLRMFAFIIGLITILGSSIALMNIMLVSVTERTREIGIRKAIGANNFLVLLQFLIETLLITFLGGIIGIIFGLMIGFLVAKLMKMPFSMPWDALGIAIFVIFVVAIISGLYPAYKASRLNPIQALRYE